MELVDMQNIELFIVAVRFLTVMHPEKSQGAFTLGLISGAHPIRL
jgi:hypothetical protein